jgi:hypothetical protein
MKHIESFVKTDASRPSTERADCTVRAIATCMNIPYEVAHEIMRNKGRKDRCRTHFRLPIIQDLGFDDRAELSCMTVERSLKGMNHGRFIVSVRGHVFAVVNGVVYDQSPPPKKQRVEMVYEYIQLRR